MPARIVEEVEIRIVVSVSEAGAPDTASLATAGAVSTLGGAGGQSFSSVFISRLEKRLESYVISEINKRFASLLRSLFTRTRTTTTVESRGGDSQFAQSLSNAGAEIAGLTAKASRNS